MENVFCFFFICFKFPRVRQELIFYCAKLTLSLTLSYCICLSICRSIDLSNKFHVDICAACLILSEQNVLLLPPGRVKQKYSIHLMDSKECVHWKSAPSCIDGNLRCLCSHPYLLSSSLLLLPVRTELRAINYFWRMR